MMAPRPAEFRRRAWLLLPLALLHAALLGGLAQQQRAAPRSTAPALTVVRLLTQRPPPQERPREATRPPVPRAPLPVIVPPAVLPPVAMPAPAATITAAPLSQAPAAEAARPAPLILALPPALSASDAQRWRNPALGDPRANTRRPDFAARMADTLGTDTRLREESLGPGRHRFRQGSSCVETAESRIAQIDPMGETMRGSPRLVTDCK